MSCLRATILLLGLFGLSAGAGAVEGLVLSRSGPAVSGGITVAATGPTCADSQLAWDGVAVASFATPVAGSLDQGVLLANGELLRGVPRAVGSSGLSFAGDLHGLRELPLPSLAVIVLGAVRSQQLDGLAGGETGAVLVNGDRLAGQMAFLNDEAVGIDTGRRVAQVPRARVAAVILRPVVHPPSGLWLLLSGGDRLLVTSLAPVAGGIAVQGEAGRLVLPLAMFSVLWREDARCVALTRRTPLRATGSDRQGVSLTQPGARGFPARFGGWSAAQGLELPARGELAWAAGPATAFVAWVVCAPGRLASTAQVVVDGRIAWEGVLAPGAAAVPVRVPLASAREVAVLCPAAADGESAAQGVVWCHPTLVQ